MGCARNVISGLERQSLAFRTRCLSGWPPLRSRVRVRWRELPISRPAPAFPFLQLRCGNGLRMHAPLLRVLSNRSGLHMQLSWIPLFAQEEERGAPGAASADHEMALIPQ